MRCDPLGMSRSCAQHRMTVQQTGTCLTSTYCASGKSPSLQDLRAAVPCCPGAYEWGALPPAAKAPEGIHAFYVGKAGSHASPGDATLASRLRRCVFVIGHVCVIVERKSASALLPRLCCARQRGGAASQPCVATSSHTTVPSCRSRGTRTMSCRTC